MFHCYRQLEHSDCGLTCIRMVARHYGKRIPMAFLKKSSDLNRLGMSIGDMTSCLAAIGMESMAVKISATEAANMPLPAILFWSQKHFVVLYQGIDTTIGVAGIEMSGGQKQRLMIARALYKDPDILFLDEATSSLDANNERNITENIRLLGQGKTIIIAAHRLSTVKNADKIVFIKEGEISEFGTHDELVALGKDYRRLVKNQLDLST